MTDIAGFLAEAPRSANGRPLNGRLVCPDIQWTGSGSDVLGTFTITARELLAAADSNLLWTDQDVQRGVKPEHADAPKELSLADGYPDPAKYIFVTENADDIAEKLLNGRRLYLNPLIWNLRPGFFEAFRDEESGDLHIYHGKIYLPDSHHRHQAILKACRIYRDASTDYPHFSLDKQFKVDLYFLSRADEGNYFFDKNQRPRQTAKSKAFDLTTEDALSILAKEIASRSTSLRGNVNRVTDRLTAQNKQVVTLSTLREMSKSLVSGDHIDESEVEGLAVLSGTFYDLLASVRPELGHLDVISRKSTREISLVDSAVMMHGYAGLMRDFISDVPVMGAAAAKRHWAERLRKLADVVQHTATGWQGDLFSKANPMWVIAGILKPNARGSSMSQINTGATRSTSARILRAVVAGNGSAFGIAPVEVA